MVLGVTLLHISKPDPIGPLCIGLGKPLPAGQRKSKNKRAVEKTVIYSNRSIARTVEHSVCSDASNGDRIDGSSWQKRAMSTKLS